MRAEGLGRESQEGSNSSSSSGGSHSHTLTTCTKMTEEVDKRHGINGTSSNNTKEDRERDRERPHQQGGRLKFYKDGKMILELSRSRDGEKVNWVSVPRKTIWVPAPSGTPVHTPPSARQERAASLSVSDDNSSVQSSPWQRDHCWKQTAPRRGVGTEMSLLYIRPTCLPARLLRCPAARIKRRRPLCPAPVLPPPANGCSSPSPEHSVPYRNTEKPTALGKFKFLRNKDSVAEPIVLRVYKKCKKNYKKRELCKVVETLNERLINFTPVNAKITNCKQEHSMVSPRKRILREFEKVSLEDLSNKRSRARHLSSNPQPGPSCASDSAPKLFNGSSHPRSNPVPSKPVSSYTIHSILSMSENSPHRSPEHSSIKKPMSYSGSSKTESPVSIHSPDSHSTRASSHYSKASSPLSPDVRRSHYGYAKTESPSPSPSPEQYRRLPAPLPAPRPPYPHHALAYPELGEYFYNEEYPYHLYQSNPYLAPSYVSPYMNPYRPPHMLMQYPTLPPGHWPPLSHSLLTDPTSREDTPSDLPLNLSKH